VDLVVAGHDFHSRATVIDRGQQSEFATGLTAYLRAVPQARRALGLPRHAPPRPVGSDLRRVSDTAVLVRVDLDD
jgi:hypothetical protein